MRRGIGFGSHVLELVDFWVGCIIHDVFFVFISLALLRLLGFAEGIRRSYEPQSFTVFSCAPSRVVAERMSYPPNVLSLDSPIKSSDTARTARAILCLKRVSIPIFNNQASIPDM